LTLNRTGFFEFDCCVNMKFDGRSTDELIVFSPNDTFGPEGGIASRFPANHGDFRVPWANNLYAW
jgi:hypothetical protein